MAAKLRASGEWKRNHDKAEILKTNPNRTHWKTRAGVIGIKEKPMTCNNQKGKK